MSNFKKGLLSRVFLLEVKLDSITFFDFRCEEGFCNELNVKVGLPNNQAIRVEGSQLDVKYENRGTGESVATFDCTKSCLFAITNQQLYDPCKIDVHVYRKRKQGGFPRVGSCTVDLGGQFINLMNTNCKSRFDTFWLQNVLQKTIGAVTLSIRITYNGTKIFPNAETKAEWETLSSLAQLSPAPSKSKFIETCAPNQRSEPRTYDDVTRSNSVTWGPLTSHNGFNIESNLPPYFQTAILKSLGEEINDSREQTLPNRLKVVQERYQKSCISKKETNRPKSGRKLIKLTHKEKKSKTIGCDDKSCPYYKQMKKTKIGPVSQMCCPLKWTKDHPQCGGGQPCRFLGQNEDFERQTRPKYYVQPVYCLISPGITGDPDKDTYAVFVRPRKVLPVAPWLNKKAIETQKTHKSRPSTHNSLKKKSIC